MMEIQKSTITLSILALIFFLSDPSLPAVESRIFSIVDEHHGGNAYEMKVYIVHVQKPERTKFRRFQERRNWYMSFLPNATLSTGKPRMVYTYRNVISGFAAWLTQYEAEAVKAKEGYVLSYPEKEYFPLTTYTPQFMGLNWWGGLWVDSNYGGGITIGMLDSGIKPTHPSFRDHGMTPPPMKWAGECYWGRPNCNNKLIGAMGFRHGSYPEPKDNTGHGTHTSGIAGGNFVFDAGQHGLAPGTASGIAPRSHLAVYKVLFQNATGHSTTNDSDLLMGIDKAIRDGVDILSMSLGSLNRPFHEDAVAIGSFAAIAKGIFPCAAAGNHGPFRSALDNNAPWILTVGASSTDRRIRATVRLGNGREYYGQSGFQPESHNSTIQLPIVYPGSVNKTLETLTCQTGSLDLIDVKGMIVLCGAGYTTPGAKGEVVKNAGGAGMVVMNQVFGGNTTYADMYVLPASNVRNADALEILDYFQNTPNPTAAIDFKGTQFGARPAPSVPAFSSRGPSLINGNIIKPDVIAPGADILAAWPFEVGPDRTGSNKTFKFARGTSMATPHVSGAVALLKNRHPNWSPAAIKSAIMTTAYTKDLDLDHPIPIATDVSRGPASVFDMGSGHIDPTAANDPGLVYDLHYYDYIHYLCGMGYSDKVVTAIARGAVNCSQVNVITSEQLNYPSIAVKFRRSRTKTVKRTVTNVGNPNSAYWVDFKEPKGVSIEVYPSWLQFTRVGEELSFNVTLRVIGALPAPGGFVEGQFSWVSGKYRVRSPIAVLT